MRILWICFSCFQKRLARLKRDVHFGRNVKYQVDLYLVVTYSFVSDTLVIYLDACVFCLANSNRVSKCWLPWLQQIRTPGLLIKYCSCTCSGD